MQHNKAFAIFACVVMHGIFGCGTNSIIAQEKKVNPSVFSLAYQPDGRRIAAGQNDGKIHIWDPRDSRLKKSWQAHSDAILGIRYSVDGKMIASASADGTVKLWEVSTGAETLLYKGKIVA